MIFMYACLFKQEMKFFQKGEYVCVFLLRSC